MKNLIDIYEKLDINKINLHDKFPIDGTIKEMSDFLKEIGFEEIEIPNTWSKVQKDFQKASYPIFTKYIQNKAGVIAIYNGTNKIHKDLFIFDDSDLGKTYYIFYNLDTKTFVKTGDAKKVTKEQFLKEISNIL